AGSESTQDPKWNQLVEKLERAVQLTNQGNAQVSAAIQRTKQEAAASTSPPGWSLYGKIDASGAWTQERYFHSESSGQAIPHTGEVAVADTFVNVRRAPSAYIASQKTWRFAAMLGVI